jgi:hypothetical protein
MQNVFLKKLFPLKVSSRYITLHIWTKYGHHQVSKVLLMGTDVLPLS